MIIRSIDATGDWLFGKGVEDYKSGLSACAQDIQTRLLEFLGDCFFNTQAGVNWFGRLGNKNQIALDLEISSVILNTTGVTGLVELSRTLDDNRHVTFTYTVTTVFTGSLLKGGAAIGYLLSESGDFLTDESGNKLLG